MPDRLQIAFVLREVPVGGLERAVIGLANGLVDAGHHVKLIVVEDGDNALLDQFHPAVRTIVTSGNLPARLRRLRHEVSGSVAHVQFSEGKARPAFRLMLPGPTVVTYQNRYFRSRIGDWTEVACARAADALVAVSDDVRLYCESIGLPRRKLSVIHNGVAFQAPQRPAARNPDPHHCLAVARLVPQKDYPTLLRGFAHASSREERLRLTVIGSGSEEPSLHQLADRLGLDGKLTWLGETNSAAVIDDFRSRAGIFLSASRWEGFSVSLLEAMAHGQAVVASDIAPHREALADDCVYFPVGDPAALGDRILGLAADRARQEKLGMAGRRRAEAFSETASLEKYLALYRRVSAVSAGAGNA
ncbi:glycosyltransferase family 4 protein [Micromonosporaceae bacterium B7E4]